MPVTATPATSTESGPVPPILLRGATFGYGDRDVIRGLDLTITTGEVVAILGPNGSGKSTLVRGLLGLAEHHGGDVELFGTPLRSFHERTRLGYVPQRHTLAASVRATAEEIVAIGRVAAHPWWAPWRANAAADRRIVADALAQVGLGDHARADVSTLSGGQQRRVLIARALAADTDILLMDEPTAGVDQGHQRVLATVLARLARQGHTMVVVTHELSALADVVTRAIVIDGGVVTFDGPPSRLPSSAYEHAHHDDVSPTGRPVLGRGPFDPAGRGTQEAPHA